MGIKDLLKNPAKGAVEGVISGVADVVDRFVHTPEEKEQLKAEIEKEITKRWQADATSDSWLSKNVRPLSLVWFMVILTVLLFSDGNIGDFTVSEEWIPLLKNIGLTILGGYFVLREGGKFINKL
jgi:hypothetical protein